ncbi:hypothetical protein [Chryseobacterium sp. X308]|nr:hypothetical protein [Chryseobacterium sp. X308]
MKLIAFDIIYKTDVVKIHTQTLPCAFSSQSSGFQMADENKISW